MPTNTKHLSHLERQLKHTTHPHDRFIALRQAAAAAVFTDIKAAQHHLQAMQRELATALLPAEESAVYHTLSGYVSNQLYDYEDAELHFKKAIELLEQYGDYKQLIEAYIDLSGTLINLDKRQEAAILLEKTAKLLRNYPDDHLEARWICREGFMLLHNTNYAHATEQLRQAAAKIKDLHDLTLKDYYFLTLIHSGLGSIYERTDDYEKAIQAYTKVVHICEERGIRSRLSWHYLHVGNAYMAKEDFEAAELYFRKSIDLQDDVSQHARAGAYANLGYCSLRSKKYKLALSLFNNAARLYGQIAPKNHANFFFIERWKAQLQKELGDNAKALQHFQKALHHAQSSEDSKLLSVIFKDIAEYYAAAADYQNAYEYQLLHDDATERYIENVNKRTLMELEIKYDADKRRQEMEMLRLQATKLQLKALRAQMNPHFMFNVLNSIQYYITSKKIDSAADYLSKFAKLTRSILDYSDEESITLEEEMKFLNEYLHISQKLRFAGTMQYTVTIADDIEEDILKIPTMIVQPFVENAIEHGIRNQNNGFIKIHFEHTDDESLLCTVEDNGIGIEASRHLKKTATHESHRSKGMSIIMQRLEILHQSLGLQHRLSNNPIQIEQLTNAVGEVAGTRVSIHIPLL